MKTALIFLVLYSFKTKKNKDNKMEFKTALVNNLGR